MQTGLQAYRRLISCEANTLKIHIPAFTHPVSIDRPHRRIDPLLTSGSRVRRLFTTSSKSRLETQRPPLGSVEDVLFSKNPRELPLTCPGCGGPAQTLHPEEAGYYSRNRKPVKEYLQDGSTEENQVGQENEVFQSAVENASPEILVQLGISRAKPSADAQLKIPTSIPATGEIPVCDRCHHLIHHGTADSIVHASLEAIENTVAESPNRKNHIYHVIDAADFPMSIIPDIERRLSLAKLRTQNRRSKSHTFVKGREAEMSFIITRSDLLAPEKEQVDGMFVMLREVLREALNTKGRDVRLGNIVCVSAKRGWWTKDLKEKIYERGGAAWLVGRANVGKSNLFQAVFPKGRTDSNVNPDRLRNEARSSSVVLQRSATQDSAFSDSSALLPPAQPEVPYPTMPVISALSGTTASPIRVPFGQGRGEVIDLPGIARRSLETFVKPERRMELVMNRRITPERIVIKAGKSLILGGLIRITPKDPETIIMAHVFAPLGQHYTSTDKAEEWQRGDHSLDGVLGYLLAEGTKASIRSAGTFKLSTDVTRKYAGPLVRKDAVGLKPENLPFVVYATDLLIEGCGWVELVAQVRRRRRVQTLRKEGSPKGEDALSTLEQQAVDKTARKASLRPDAQLPPPPEVEVFSPEGKYIGQRASLSAWLVGGAVALQAKGKPARPRRSVKNRASR